MIGLAQLPGKVPTCRQATRQIYDVDFFAGIYGISQLEDLTLTPEPGWYVELK